MSYIYRELTTSDIVQELLDDVRRGGAGWSYEGAKALAEYIQELAADIGEPWELDVVALRCDYSEYASLEAFNAEYQPSEPYKTIDDLRDDAGAVIEFNGGIIVAYF